MEIMGPGPARYDVAVPPLSAKRSQVLEALQRSGVPTTVDGLAATLDLHPNTARNHLEALVARGLATRAAAPITGRGRPAWTYTAASGNPEPDRRVRDYAGLAIALAGHISRTSSDAGADALAAGEAWGRSLAAGMTRGRPAEARHTVVDLLDELGFDPEADARDTMVRLRRCPLLDAARAQPDVVCQVHLGVVRGALCMLGGEAERVSLLPFAEPGSCRLHLLGTGARG